MTTTSESILSSNEVYSWEHISNIKHRNRSGHLGSPPQHPRSYEGPLAVQPLVPDIAVKMVHSHSYLILSSRLCF